MYILYRLQSTLRDLIQRPLRIVKYLHSASFLLLCLLGATLQAQTSRDIHDLPFQELGNLKRTTGAALTRTEVRNTPTSVTLITREMIRDANARSLDERVELYVPNMLRMGVSGGPAPRSVCEGPSEAGITRRSFW